MDVYLEIWNEYLFHKIVRFRWNYLMSRTQQKSKWTSFCLCDLICISTNLMWLFFHEQYQIIWWNPPILAVVKTNGMNKA